ncbi:NIPA-like protein [Mya arenaria]|uniref:NIPA-like protein n=1 Tax=Mya arenaria TaxID=6604 RepID=A0ABY7FW05_MYAAR|nr:NIPA-like protein [Mya arenaria]
MAAESTPAKIRRLFSSFLSDKTNSNHFDDDGTLPKEAEENLKESQERRDKELFFKRVETYSALTWFAKPPDVSPLVCASYGWENTDTDMLRCVNCRAFVCGTLPKQVDAESYKKCCEELKRKLKEAHEIVCKWSSNPTPVGPNLIFSSVPIVGEKLAFGIIATLSLTKKQQNMNWSSLNLPKNVMQKASKLTQMDKQSFDPLAEHRYWCLIIHSEAFHEPGTFAKVSLATTPNPIARQPDSRCSSVSLPTSPTTQSEFTNPDMDRDHTWLKVMKVLSDTNKSEEFQAQMKSSPPMACVQRLRHVLRKCTSPDKLSTVNSKIAS